jgi:hypothetical protein
LVHLTIRPPESDGQSESHHPPQCLAPGYRKSSIQSAMEAVLNRPPVIGFFLIIQVADASDTRSMALAFRPVDR